jgi:hypothetical protein
MLDSLVEAISDLQYVSLIKINKHERTERTGPTHGLNGLNGPTACIIYMRETTRNERFSYFSSNHVHACSLMNENKKGGAETRKERGGSGEWGVGSGEWGRSTRGTVIITTISIILGRGGCAL